MCSCPPWVFLSKSVFIVFAQACRSASHLGLGNQSQSNSPPPASTRCQLTINSLPTTVYFVQCGIVSTRSTRVNRLLTSTLATQPWWCWVRDDGGNVWGCHSQSISLLSVIPTTTILLMKVLQWLSLSPSLVKLQEDGSSQWGLQTARERGTAWVGEMPFLHTQTFTFILIWHIFFQEENFSCFPKIQNESHLIGLQWIDFFFWNCGLDLSILHAVPSWEQGLCLAYSPYFSRQWHTSQDKFLGWMNSEPLLWELTVCPNLC